MHPITTRSFARAGLLGNPSDGYFGKTLSFAFAEFGVELTMEESEKIRFIQGEVDNADFSSLESLVKDLRLFGYYGGIRLLKAVTKRFFEYCVAHDIPLAKRNFTVGYKIKIPRLVGLSGSSAICSAMLKALCQFYEVEIPMEIAPTICLEAEQEELRINAGYQDRVIQIYNGLVFMDFERSYLEAHHHGRYEQLVDKVKVKGEGEQRKLDLKLYVSYDQSRAEESGEAHKEVKRMFEAKNADVLAAMSEFADIAQQGRDLIVAATNHQSQTSNHKLSSLIDANFDLRDRIFHVAPENRRMVMTARSVGASAKFAGSGGAIVGLYEDDAQFAALTSALAAIGCRTLKPTIATKTLENSANCHFANPRAS